LLVAGPLGAIPVVREGLERHGSTIADQFKPAPSAGWILPTIWTTTVGGKV
jgi:hypothetical protein